MCDVNRIRELFPCLNQQLNDFITHRQNYQNYLESLQSPNPQRNFKFNPLVPPLPFRGNLNADIVIVGLNPKVNSNNPQIDPNITTDIQNLMQDGNIGQFIRERLCNFAETGHFHPYHKKTWAFLSGLNNNIFDMRKNNNKWEFIFQQNNIIDADICQKLYSKILTLEWIPYGSHQFKTNFLQNPVLSENFKNICKVITCYSRMKVAFMGAIFYHFLNSCAHDGHVQIGDFEITIEQPINLGDTGKYARFAISEHNIGREIKCSIIWGMHRGGYNRLKILGAQIA